jgi:hypothetical protein
MWLAVPVLLLLLAWILSTRANELCVIALSLEGARLVRGRAPGALLADAADISRRARVEGARIRVVVESQSPRLVAPAALSDEVAQQLRNVVGQYTVGQFRLGQRP